MTRFTALLALCGLALAAPAAPAAETAYFPPAGHWEERPAAVLGIDGPALQQAVDFALSQETKLPRDLSVAIPLSWVARSVRTRRRYAAKLASMSAYGLWPSSTALR